MATIRNSWLIAATVGVLAVGGCATTGGGLTNSAARLERSAYALQEEANDGDVRGDFRSDARDLAEESRDFRRVVEDHRSSREEVRDAFDDVSKRYHAMRDDMERHQDREANAEFHDVTEAYLDVERAMRSRDGRHDRLARDD
jgi:hypothetical protein